MAIRLIRQIGAGGMGRVFEARMAMPRGCEMPVAVKLPTTDLEDPIKRARVEREIETALRVSYGHPNLVGAYCWGVTLDHRPFLVMELVAASLATVCE